MLSRWSTRDDHSCVGGWKGEELPPSVFTVPISGSFYMDNEKGGWGEKQEKKKDSLSLRGKIIQNYLRKLSYSNPLFQTYVSHRQPYSLVSRHIFEFSTIGRRKLEVSESSGARGEED